MPTALERTPVLESARPTPRARPWTTRGRRHPAGEATSFDDRTVMRAPPASDAQHESAMAVIEATMLVVSVAPAPGARAPMGHWRSSRRCWLPSWSGYSPGAMRVTPTCIDHAPAALRGEEAGPRRRGASSRRVPQPATCGSATTSAGPVRVPRPPERRRSRVRPVRCQCERMAPRRLLHPRLETRTSLARDAGSPSGGLRLGALDGTRHGLVDASEGG